MTEIFLFWNSLNSLLHCSARNEVLKIHCADENRKIIAAEGEPSKKMVARTRRQAQIETFSLSVALISMIGIVSVGPKLVWILRWLLSFLFCFVYHHFRSSVAVRTEPKIPLRATERSARQHLSAL